VPSGANSRRHQRPGAPSAGDISGQERLQPATSAARSAVSRRSTRSPLNVPSHPAHPR
jgi:hypothetical protein